MSRLGIDDPFEDLFEGENIATALSTLAGILGNQKLKWDNNQFVSEKPSKFLGMELGRSGTDSITSEEMQGKIRALFKAASRSYRSLGKRNSNSQERKQLGVLIRGASSGLATLRETYQSNQTKLAAINKLIASVQMEMYLSGIGTGPSKETYDNYVGQHEEEMGPEIARLRQQIQTTFTCYYMDQDDLANNFVVGEKVVAGGVCIAFCLCWARRKLLLGKSDWKAGTGANSNNDFDVEGIDTSKRVNGDRWRKKMTRINHIQAIYMKEVHTTEENQVATLLTRLETEVDVDHGPNKHFYSTFSGLECKHVVKGPQWLPDLHYRPSHGWESRPGEGAAVLREIYQAIFDDKKRAPNGEQRCYLILFIAPELNGHCFAMERLPNNEVHFFDPNLGEFRFDMTRIEEFGEPLWRFYSLGGKCYNKYCITALAKKPGWTLPNKQQNQLVI